MPFARIATQDVYLRVCIDLTFKSLTLDRRSVFGVNTALNIRIPIQHIFFTIYSLICVIKLAVDDGAFEVREIKQNT